MPRPCPCCVSLRRACPRCDSCIRRFALRVRYSAFQVRPTSVICQLFAARPRGPFSFRRRWNFRKAFDRLEWSFLFRRGRAPKGNRAQHSWWWPGGWARRRPRSIALHGWGKYPFHALGVLEVFCRAPLRALRHLGEWLGSDSHIAPTVGQHQSIRGAVELNLDSLLPC